MNQPVETVRGFLQRFGLAGTRGIVAISGGPDSVALACILRQMLHEGVLEAVVLAHVNHQLRGSESDADEAFVMELASAWQLPCRAIRIDAAAAARQRGDNLEQTARQLRYDWLHQVAQAEGAAWLATGHSADDQAETVLHRLLRGTGLQGLCAMAPCRKLGTFACASGSCHQLDAQAKVFESDRDSVELIRPLLTVRRADLLTYLRAEKQTFRQDSSNLDVAFLRNRLRLHLLPLLAEQYQPAIVAILCRLADQAQAEQAEMHALAQDLCCRSELPRAGPLLVFRVAPLAAASPHLIAEMFRLVWQREGWPMNAMDRTSWLRLDDLVHGRVTGHDFPASIHGRRRGDVLQVGQSP